MVHRRALTSRALTVTVCSDIRGAVQHAGTPLLDFSYVLCLMPSNGWIQHQNTLKMLDWHIMHWVLLCHGAHTSSCASIPARTGTPQVWLLSGRARAALGLDLRAAGPLGLNRSTRQQNFHFYWAGHRLQICLSFVKRKRKSFSPQSRVSPARLPAEMFCHGAPRGLPAGFTVALGSHGTEWTQVSWDLCFIIKMKGQRRILLKCNATAEVLCPLLSWFQSAVSWSGGGGEREHVCLWYGAPSC